jgi:hypothetical protein
MYYIMSTGGWEDTELQDDAANRIRIVWVAAGYIIDNAELSGGEAVRSNGLLGDPVVDPYAPMSCVHCGNTTTGTCRVGDEDWATCSRCNDKSRIAGMRLAHKPNIRG